MRKQTERSYRSWEFSRSQPQDNERQKKSSLHAVRHFLDHEQEQPSVIAVHPCYRPRQLLKISSLSAVKSPYWGPSAIATRGPYSKSLPAFRWQERYDHFRPSRCSSEADLCAFQCPPPPRLRRTICYTFHIPCETEKGIGQRGRAPFIREPSERNLIIGDLYALQIVHIYIGLRQSGR